MTLPLLTEPEKKLYSILIAPSAQEQKDALTQFKSNISDYALLLKRETRYHQSNDHSNEKEMHICLFVSELHHKKYLFLSTLEVKFNHVQQYFYGFTDYPRQFKPEFLEQTGLGDFFAEINTVYRNWKLEHELTPPMNKSSAKKI